MSLFIYFELNEKEKFVWKVCVCLFVWKLCVRVCVKTVCVCTFVSTCPSVRALLGCVYIASNMATLFYFHPSLPIHLPNCWNTFVLRFTSLYWCLFPCYVWFSSLISRGPSDLSCISESPQDCPQVLVDEPHNCCVRLSAPTPCCDTPAHTERVLSSTMSADIIGSIQMGNLISSGRGSHSGPLLVCSSIGVRPPIYHVGECAKGAEHYSVHPC